MKKIFTCLIALMLSFTIISNTSYANAKEKFESTDYSSQITPADNGCYFETTIIKLSTLSRASNTITRRKVTNYRNSSGDILWSVYLDATFTYNGKTAHCDSCYAGKNIVENKWSIPSIICSKSGATAKADITAKLSLLSGATSTISKQITLTCSPNGQVS